jgi:hypothetical protein
MTRSGSILTAALAFMCWCGSARTSGAAALTTYQQSCVDAAVPLPPPFAKPSDGPEPWKFEGKLLPGLVFASNLPTNEIYAYRTDGPQAGVCVALPRTNAAGVIELLGVICQATNAVELKGEAAPAVHACFWDNIDAAGKKITSSKLKDFNPAVFQGGDVLKENCTNCHRGDNAYVVVKFTPEWKADNDHANAPPDAPYVPLGQAAWLNPPPTLKLTGGCTACHVIPGLLGPDPKKPMNKSLYCSVVARNFILRRYPAGTLKAGKFLMPPGQARDKDDLTDIKTIKDACAALGVKF